MDALLDTAVNLPKITCDVCGQRNHSAQRWMRVRFMHTAPGSEYEHEPVPDPSFRYEPSGIVPVAYLCSCCEDGLVDHFLAEFADRPATMVPRDAVRGCVFCGDDIMLAEVCFLISDVIAAAGKRSNVVDVRVHDEEQGVLCVSCVQHALELIEDELNDDPAMDIPRILSRHQGLDTREDNECLQCVKDRCYLHGSCGCSCHS